MSQETKTYLRTIQSLRAEFGNRLGTSLFPHLSFGDITRLADQQIVGDIELITLREPHVPLLGTTAHDIPLENFLIASLGFRLTCVPQNVWLEHGTSSILKHFVIFPSSSPYLDVLVTWFEHHPEGTTRHDTATSSSSAN